MDTIPIRPDLDLTDALIRQSRATQNLAVDARLAFQLTRWVAHEVRVVSSMAREQVVQRRSEWSAFISERGR